MKLYKPIIWIFGLVLSLSTLAQTSVPPPPKPADSGPSLAVTMQFIRDKLSDIGKVNFVAYWHNTSENSDGSNIVSEEISNVAVDNTQCQISWHWTEIWHGVTGNNLDIEIPLRTVQKIEVMPNEQFRTEVYAKAGNPNMLEQSTSPAVTALLVRLPHNVSNYLPFTDADLANRVAKAMVHAVELCGGGDKEPF